MDQSIAISQRRTHNERINLIYRCHLVNVLVEEGKSLQILTIDCKLYTYIFKVLCDEDVV